MFQAGCKSPACFKGEMDMQVQEAKVVVVNAQQQTYYGEQQPPQEIQQQIYAGWKIAAVHLRQQDFGIVGSFVEVFYLVRDVEEPV
ncbi:hypothetical protein LCGC14_2045830 [marine sediment metagenome]|uniref:Uncharacterized protein n=1 Tax=marine sediment metagenome TaxID=412755 RepID=A0A0F9H3Y0_9ZZZZ